MCGAIHRLSTAHPPLFDGIVSMAFEAVIFNFVTNSGWCCNGCMPVPVPVFPRCRCSW